MTRKTDIVAHKPNAAIKDLCVKTEQLSRVTGDSLNRLGVLTAPEQYSGCLPLPPSANALVMPLHGRLIKSKAGRDWLKVSAAVLGRAPVPLDGPLELLVSFYVPSVSSDLSNRIKALEDSLVAGGYLHDDCQIVEIRAFKAIIGRVEMSPDRRCAWRLAQAVSDVITRDKIVGSKKGGGSAKR